MKPHVILLCFIFLFSSSCLKQGKLPKIPGVDGPSINVLDGKILLSLGLENIDLPAGVTLPLPKLDHSTVTVSPRLEGGSLIQVVFDLKDVESDDFRVVPPELLPDGRPFPFIAGGELPALAFHIPRAFDMTFYASKKVFGFFLPIKLPSEFQVNVPFRLKVNGKNVGIISGIGNNPEGHGSGLVLLLTLEQIQQNPELQKLMKFSKKHKNTVF